MSSITGSIGPMIESYIVKNEPALEAALVQELAKLKGSNPNEFNLFLTNWRKINAAIEKSAVPTIGGNILTDASNAIANLFKKAAPTETDSSMTPPTPVSTPAPEPVPAAETGFTAPSDMTTEPIATNTPVEPVPETVNTESTTEPTTESTTEPTTESTTNEPELGGRKRRHKRKTVKQHRKRTHRVKHRKH